MELLTNSSVTGLKLKLATEFLVFFAPWLLVIGKVSLISNNRIHQNAVTKPSNKLPTALWTEPMHHLILGCCVFFMCVSSLITHTVNPLVMFPSTTLLAARSTLVLYFVFIFWEKVYYMRVDTGFPSRIQRRCGTYCWYIRHTVVML